MLNFQTVASFMIYLLFVDFLRQIQRHMSSGRIAYLFTTDRVDRQFLLSTRRLLLNERNFSNGEVRVLKNNDSYLRITVQLT